MNIWKLRDTSIRTSHFANILTAAVLLLTPLLPFALYAPNRVAVNEALYVFDSGAGLPLILLTCVLLTALYGFLPIKRRGIVVPAVITLCALISLSVFGRTIPPEYAATARVNGGPGFWLWILCAYLYGISSNEAKLSMPIPVLLVLFFLFSGALEFLGPVREFAIKKERFAAETAAHLSLSGSATLIACIIAIPAGIIAYRQKFFSRFIFTGANTIQTLPSLALFGLLIAPLAWISTRFPLLRDLGVKGVGNFPALIALSGYACLPILRNTFTSLENLPKNAVEAGKGMGMSPLRLLFMVEIPLALPIILGGIRIAFVQTIGNASVAALIGAGGLGNFIFQGLGQAAPDLILLGVVPLIALAVAADSLLKLLERFVTPTPLLQKTGVTE